MSLYSTNQNISSNPLSIDGLITNDYDILTVNGVGLVPYTGASQAVNLNNKAVSNLATLSVNGATSSDTLTVTNNTSTGSLTSIPTTFPVANIYINSSTDIYVVMIPYPTSFIVGATVQIYNFNTLPAFNRTYVITSVNLGSSIFYANYTSGLTVGDRYYTSTASAFITNGSTGSVSCMSLSSQISASLANLTATGTNAISNLTTTGTLATSGATIAGTSFLEFGFGTSGKQANAGKIAYELFEAGYLGIVGAGTSIGSRNVKIYDNATIAGTLNVIGIPTVPTPATSDNSTQIATTAFVNNFAIPISGTCTGVNTTLRLFNALTTAVFRITSPSGTNIFQVYYTSGVPEVICSSLQVASSGEFRALGNCNLGTTTCGSLTASSNVGITGSLGVTGNTSLLGTFTQTGQQTFNLGAYGSSGDYIVPPTNFYGSTVYDGFNGVNIQNQASQYGRNILYMTGRYEASNDAWAFTNPRNAIIFRTQANLNATPTWRYTIQNFFQELGILCAGKSNVPITKWSNDGTMTHTDNMTVGGLLTATKFQSSGNGLNTSTPATIVGAVTDWTTSMGSFATVTSSAGVRGSGVGFAVDSTGDTWMLSLQPTTAWRAFNQVATNYNYFTNGFSSSTPIISINANGTSTYRSNIFLKGNSSQGTEQANSPNLVSYVSSDSYARPTLSTFNYEHDNMALMFDIYYVNAVGWVTCYNSINWMMYKYNNMISFQYVPATTAGTTVTPVTTLQLTSTATIVQSNPLQVRGPANSNSTSSTSPNIKLYTDADAYAYPTISTFNYNHDNSAIQFDMYYQAGWYSSYNTVNWQIYKQVGRLFFQYIDAVPAGTASSLKNMMVLTSTGVVISPTSGSYVAPNVLHLIKDVSAYYDTTLMITFENTVGGFFDYMIGYYRNSAGEGNFAIRGGTASYTTAIDLVTVKYDGKLGCNGVTSPQFALDTGYSSIGASTMTSNIGLTFQTGTSSDKCTINAGGDTCMTLSQTVYHNIAQKANLTTGSVGAWQGGTLFTRNASQGGNDKGLLLGWSDGLDGGLIVTLQPSVVWKNMFVYTQVCYFYYQGSLSGYVTNTGFVSVSDEREKEDIKPLKTTRSLEHVLACKPMTYKRKCSDPLTTEDTKNKNHIGLIAQQACESNPHCISTWENEEKEERFGIQYNDYVVHLIGAVQEQQKQIKEQADMINTLSSHLTEMTLQINKLTEKLFSQDKSNGK